MNQPVLTGPERPPAAGGTPTSIVMLLHGYGADGNDLIGLAPLLAQHLPHAQFVSPHAPFACEMSPMGRQWFSLRDWSRESMRAGADAALPALSGYIDSVLARFGLPEGRLAFVGFSQGTMMALHCALRRKDVCAGIAGFSGMLLGDDAITAKPPVCLIHGDQDMVVPFAALAYAQGLLEKAGLKATAHTRAGLAHGIDPEGLDIAGTFLAECLA